MHIALGWYYYSVVSAFFLLFRKSLSFVLIPLPFISTLLYKTLKIDCLEQQEETDQKSSIFRRLKNIKVIQFKTVQLSTSHKIVFFLKMYNHIHLVSMILNCVIYCAYFMAKDALCKILWYIKLASSVSVKGCAHHVLIQFSLLICWLILTFIVIY